MRIVYHLISYGYGINKSHRNLGALVSLWLEEYNQSFFSDQTGRLRIYETTPKCTIICESTRLRGQFSDARRKPPLRRQPVSSAVQKTQGRDHIFQQFLARR